MKTLKFAPDLVPLVISGEKTATWRLFDDKDLQVGDELNLLNKANGQQFATARITRVKEKSLGTLEPADFAGHEQYADSAELLRAYRSYYGDRVTLETSIKMIDFELI